MLSHMANMHFVVKENLELKSRIYKRELYPLIKKRMEVLKFHWTVIILKAWLKNPQFFPIATKYSPDLFRKPALCLRNMDFMNHNISKHGHDTSIFSPQPSGQAFFIDIGDGGFAAVGCNNEMLFTAFAERIVTGGGGGKS